MDSGNSGSLQSSSGDEDYDARAESLSPFFNPSSHYASISNQLHPQSLPHHQTHPPPTLFNPLPHNLEPFSQSPTNPHTNPLYNLDLFWSRDLRSDTNLITEQGNFTVLSSSSTTSQQSLLGGAQGFNHGQFSSSQSIIPQSDETNKTKNPKKRTRASRRAPTTVLTTDTSNFRQMVQEFTGIPTAPFSSSPYSRRFDLFGSSTAHKSRHFDTLEHLLPSRPSAQKVQVPPFASSSFSNQQIQFYQGLGQTADLKTTHSELYTSSSSASNIGTTSIAGISSSLSSRNYQIPCDIGLQKQSENLLNMQNQVLTFQSLMQSPHQLAKAPIFGTKSQGGSRIHSLDGLGLSHENVSMKIGGFTGQGTSDGVQVRSQNSQQNYSSEKGLENIVSSRGEGNVESWINCPAAD